MNYENINFNEILISGSINNILDTNKYNGSILLGLENIILAASSNDKGIISPGFNSYLFLFIFSFPVYTICLSKIIVTSCLRKKQILQDKSLFECYNSVSKCVYLYLFNSN